MKREDEEKLRQILQHLPAKERPLWIAEANRLARLVELYQRLKPKRRNNPLTGQKEFVPEVIALCQEARCEEAALLAKEPHRAKAPAPDTLDDWMRAYRREGLTAFLRSVYSSPPAQADLRRAAISLAAISLTGGVHRHVDMIIPRIFHLMELNRKALLEGKVKMSQLIALAGARLMVG